MIPFITNEKYNFIMKQAKQIAAAKHTVNDAGVKQAFIHSALDKVLALFPAIGEEERGLLTKMVEIQSDVEMEQYQRTIEEYCIPFPELTDGKISKLFRKVKKLNHPPFTEEDRKHLTYASWIDKGTGRKFIIRELDGTIVGIHGRFLPSSKKGICHFCNHHSQVGLYTVEMKSKGNSDQYKVLGNYICEDAAQCNQQLTSTDKLDEFLHQTV
ncbi:FusB/FusC family EF-G-binding protein [Bacillus testis]|uniref:FusB/FusC family EF-G-binding protein n=1 Tax=Bacillus testis TaxID=1622072 RepID=UPI00067EE403|nr:elongation factor G-binding protein [Bacillus testis]